MSLSSPDAQFARPTLRFGRFADIRKTSCRSQAVIVARFSSVDIGGQFVARFSRPFRPENLGRVERTSNMKLVRIYLKRSWSLLVYQSKREKDSRETCSIIRATRLSECWQAFLSGRAFTPAASRGNHDGILTSYNSRARPARSENAQRLMKVMSFLPELEEVLLFLHQVPRQVLYTQR